MFYPLLRGEVVLERERSAIYFVLPLLKTERAQEERQLLLKC